MSSAEETKQLVISTFESKGLKYQDVSRGEMPVISVGMHLRSTNIDILIFFDQDGDSLHMSTMLPFVVPAEKLPAVLMAVNAANKSYRWIDYYVDMDDNTVMGEMDAVVDAATAGDETFELVMRMCSIVDDVFPILMRTIYS